MEWRIKYTKIHKKICLVSVLTATNKRGVRCVYNVCLKNTRIILQNSDNTKHTNKSHQPTNNKKEEKSRQIDFQMFQVTLRLCHISVHRTHYIAHLSIKLYYIALGSTEYIVVA